MLGERRTVATSVTVLMAGLVLAACRSEQQPLPACTNAPGPGTIGQLGIPARRVQALIGPGRNHLSQAQIRILTDNGNVATNKITGIEVDPYDKANDPLLTNAVLRQLGDSVWEDLGKPETMVTYGLPTPNAEGGEVLVKTFAILPGCAGNLALGPVVSP